MDEVRCDYAALTLIFVHLIHIQVLDHVAIYVVDMRTTRDICGVENLVVARYQITRVKSLMKDHAHRAGREHQ